MSTLHQAGTHPTVKTGDAVRHLIRDADIEVIPLKGLDRKLAAVSAGTTITLTCSSRLGLERTMEYTELVAKAGYRVIPHLAARQVTDQAELRRLIGRLGEIGITDLYVIGGDATPPAGRYSSALELLEDLAGIDHGIESIGVACYPEGHPSITDASLLKALRLKAPLADYMVSQLCFNADALAAWLQKIRAVDIQLPLHLALAAPLHIPNLADLSLRIGVGSSVRYLTKQHGFLGPLLGGSAYQPEKFLHQLGRELATDELRIERVHLFSFNQIDLTVDSQQRIADQSPDRLACD